MNVEIDFCVIALADYDEDGHLQLQTDSPGIDGTEGTQAAEALLPEGYHARPLDPDKGAKGEIGLGAPGIRITIGDRRYVIPLGDPRDVVDGKIPKLKKGGKMVAGGAGDHRSVLMIDGEDPAGAKKPGSIMISASYSKGGVKKSLGLSMNVRDEGAEDISLVHGDGARVTIDKDGTSVTAPNGKHFLSVANDGNVLAGATKAQGSLTVGEQVAAQAVVKGPELMALLTQLITIVSSITAVTPGAAAAALLPQLPTIMTKHLKAT